MVPLGPGQSSIRRKLRGGIEIGAGAQHRTSIGVRAIKIKSHDGVDRIATAGMVLAYRENESALGMDPNIAESEGTLGVIGRGLPSPRMTYRRPSLYSE